MHHHESAGPVVVVGTDGSATASEAVRRAADIVRSQGGRLHLVTAIDALHAAPVDSPIPEEFRVVATSAGLLAEHVLKLAASGPAAGLDTLVHAEPGDVVEALIRVADAVEADVIVVGNKRPARTPKFIAASISDRLVQKTSHDVLVVNTRYAA